MEENNKSDEVVSTTELVDAIAGEPLELEGLPKGNDLVRLFIPQSIDKPLWRILMTGHMKPKRTEPKVQRFWYNGNLITREEHDKLSVDEIRASNDVIRRSK